MSKKNIIIALGVILFVCVAGYILLVYETEAPTEENSVVYEDDYTEITTKDGISLRLPANLAIDISEPIQSDGYAFYQITQSGQNGDINKIEFYLYQDNIESTYGFEPQYSKYVSNIYYYGDGAVDMSNVHAGTLRSYRILETEAKFKQKVLPNVTHHVFDIIPKTGVTVASFGYTRNDNDPSEDLDSAWESIRKTIFIPGHLIRETYGDFKQIQ